MTAVFYFIIVANAIGSVAAPVPQSAYVPIWHVGDHWKIRYTYTIASKEDVLVGRDVHRVEVAEYQVTQETLVAGDRVFQLEVRMTDTNASFRLYFRQTDMTLRNLEQVVDPATNDRVLVKNPYGDDSVLFLHFPDAIIADFPKVANNPRPVSRIVRALEETSFRERTKLTPSHSMLITMSTVVDGKALTSTQLWKPKAKWWSTAARQLNGRTFISAELMP